MLVLRLRPLAFATFLVRRLRIGACGVGACGLWRLWQLPVRYHFLRLNSPLGFKWVCPLFFEVILRTLTGCPIMTHIPRTLQGNGAERQQRLPAVTANSWKLCLKLLCTVWVNLHRNWWMLTSFCLSLKRAKQWTIICQPFSSRLVQILARENWVLRQQVMRRDLTSTSWRYLTPFANETVG